MTAAARRRVRLAAIASAAALAAGEPLGATEVPFGPGAAVAVPGSIQALDAGDIDGDGVADFVGSIPDQDLVVAAIADGAGGFRIERLPALRPSRLALGDLDGDGDLDLVVFQEADASFRVYAARAGRFEWREDRALGVWATDLAVADLDRDGRADLAVADQPGQALVVIPGGPSGLGEPTRIPRSCGVRSVAAGDFDRDGLPDLAAALLCQRIEIHRNAGGGVFEAAAEVPGDRPARLRAADLDGDGWIDLLSGEATTSSGFERLGILWNEAGRFERRDLDLDEEVGLAIGLADLDGDGRMDPLVVASSRGDMDGVRCFVQGPGRSFDPSLLYFLGRASGASLAAAHFDRSGGPDLLVGRQTRCCAPILLLRHRGGRVWAGIQQRALSVHGRPRVQGVDLDGDGRSEVLVTTESRSFLVRGGPGGILGSLEPWDVAPGSMAADLNGDRRTDVITRDDPIVVRLTDAGGRPSPPIEYPGGALLALGDFDADGAPDLLVQGASDTLVVRLNDGSGRFGAPQTTNLAIPRHPAPGLRLYATGRFDGAGGDDLFVDRRWDEDGLGGIPKPDSIEVHACLDPRTFVRRGAYPISAHAVPGGIDALRVADLDRDGLDDVVALAGYIEGQSTISVLLNQAGAGLGPAQETTVLREEPQLVVADFAGDGAPDVAVAAWDMSENGSLIFAANRGDGRLEEPVLVPIPHQSKSAAAGDFDGDGALDLAVGYQQYAVGVGVAVLHHHPRADLPTAAAPALLEARARAGRVRLRWSAPPGPVVVERRPDHGAWGAIATLDPDRAAAGEWEDAAVPRGRYAYRLAIPAGGATRRTAELWVDVPAGALAIRPAGPHPAREVLRLRVELPGEAPAELTLLDVAGRLLRRQAVAGGPGERTIEVPLPRGARAGLIWARLRHGGAQAAARVVVAP